MSEQFNIHNPSRDDIEDLVSHIGRMAIENQGRRVLHSMFVLDDRTAALYQSYINEVLEKIGQVRDTMQPEFAKDSLDLAVKSIKYYNSATDGGEGGWVTEYVIQAKSKN